jgi:phosphoserine aminotransferase
MCALFSGSGNFEGVINAPNMMVTRENPELFPFIKLGEKIGQMQGLLIPTATKVEHIHIFVNGPSISDPSFVEPIRAAVLKGILSTATLTEVNYINAHALAAEFGLNVQVSSSDTTPSSSPYLNSIDIVTKLSGLNNQRVISGTVFGGDELRVTSIDGIDVDIPPAENMIIFNNKDTPGVVFSVSSLLADANINISHVSVGRHDHDKEGRFPHRSPSSYDPLALSCFVLDEPAPQEVLDRINMLPTVFDVTQLQMSDSIDKMFRMLGHTGEEQEGEDESGLGSHMPSIKPKSPMFSSGPTKKRPGYDLQSLDTKVLGRSHRSGLGKSRLRRAIDQTRELLSIPDDYLVGIVPASDTGAMEMALWSMLSDDRPVDACFWESFGKGWFNDCEKHLKLKNVNRLYADYGEISDFSQTSSDHDIVFTWNGTTSGVKVPNADWIREDREGLTFNDATSAVFAMPIDWEKCDVTTYSWQKVLGGEGGHGMLILSPRAVERVVSLNAQSFRPLPKIFRLLKDNGTFNASIFEGSTINTPSMLCVEDYLDALQWCEEEGGVNALITKSMNNLHVLERFVASHSDWISFLAKDPATRSNTSVCLSLPTLEAGEIKAMTKILEDRKIAYDIGSYRDAPPGLRIWCGATVEEEDLANLMPWLSWAKEHITSS